MSRRPRARGPAPRGFARRASAALARAWRLGRFWPNPAALVVGRWICDATDKMHMIVPAGIKEEAETVAKAAREAMDDD